MKQNDDDLFPQTIEEDVAEIDPVGVLQALLRCAARSARRVWHLLRPQSPASGMFDKATAPARCQLCRAGFAARCWYRIRARRYATEAVNGLPRQHQ